MTRQGSAVVIGASGGIGAAFVRRLVALGQYRHVHALSRSPEIGNDGVDAGHIDVTSEQSIAAAAERIPAPIDLVIVATGMLHGGGRMPEKALRELDGTALALSFAVNTIGPALILKHFSPLLARDRRATVAMLSARIGSISDNRSGGWYGYRASKAALNMIVKTSAIELARVRPQAICVALHPGTVDTALSSPFQARVPPGTLFAPDVAASRMLEVLDQLAPAQSGGIFAWDGQEIAP